METLTTSLEKPPEGDTEQHRHDFETYKNWIKKDRCARFTMLSSMRNDLIGQFEVHTTAKEVWDALRALFAGTSATRLRQLQMRFDSYKMDSKHTMAEHLRKMSAMIHDLNAAGNILTEEQQIQAVLRALPKSWDTMKLTMTHNESITTFAQLSRHLELEEERQGFQVEPSVYVAECSQRRTSRFKRKQHNKAHNIGKPEFKKKKRCSQRKARRQER